MIVKKKKKNYVYVRLSEEMLDDMRNMFGFTEHDIEDHVKKALGDSRLTVKAFVVTKDGFDPGPSENEVLFHVDSKGRVTVKEKE